jgi:hypothetical protein
MARHIHIHLHDDFEEKEHPRGQPGNPGQFAKKGEVHPKSHEALTKRGFKPEEGEEAHYTHTTGHRISFLPKGREQHAYGFVHTDPSGKQKKDYGTFKLGLEAGKISRGEYGGEGTSGGVAELKTPGWKTPEEVKENFFKRYGNHMGNNGASQSVFVRKANVTAAVLDHLDSRFPELRKNWKLQSGFSVTSSAELRRDKREGSNAVADYNSQYGLIRVTDKLAATETSGSLPKKGQFTVGGGNFNTTLSHEVGHSIQSAVMNAFRELNGGSFFDYFNANKKNIPKQLSKYAATNSNEWIAESFAAYSHPRYEYGNIRIDPKLKAAFDKVLGSA